jgi:multicomponent Na+:H+ antiporter subunit D
MGMIGIPPVNGFISKFIICSAAIEAGFPLIVVIILIASVITAAYYFKIIYLFFDLSTTSAKINKHSGREVASLGIIFGYWPVYILTGISILLGVFPTFGIDLLEPAVMLILSNFVP